MISEGEFVKSLEEVHPNLQKEGGDVELMNIDEDGSVKVNLQGACAGYPMSQMTIKWGVENYLKKKVPWVKAVQAG